MADRPPEKREQPKEQPREQQREQPREQPQGQPQGQPRDPREIPRPNPQSHIPAEGMKPLLPPEQPHAPAGDGPRPLPIAEAGGMVPRVISQNLRAPQGFARFVVRADIPGESHPTRYILARKGDRDAAHAFYLQNVGLRERIDRSRKASEASPTPVPILEPNVIVTELPD